MQLQVVYMEALEFSRLFQRKALNSTKGKKASTAWFWRMCWCQQKQILSRKNEAANGVRLVLVAPAVLKWSLWFLGSSRWPAGLGWLASAWRNKFMQNCIVRCRSSLFRGVPKSIWIAVLKRKRGGAFLREQEPSTIAAERSSEIF